MNKLFLIIAEDGRIFYDDSDNLEELLNTCYIKFGGGYNYYFLKQKPASNRQAFVF